MLLWSLCYALHCMVIETKSRLMHYAFSQEFIFSVEIDIFQPISLFHFTYSRLLQYCNTQCYRLAQHGSILLYVHCMWLHMHTRASRSWNPIATQCVACVTCCLSLSKFGKLCYHAVRITLPCMWKLVRFSVCRGLLVSTNSRAASFLFWVYFVGFSKLISTLDQLKLLTSYVPASATIWWRGVVPIIFHYDPLACRLLS